MKKIVRIGIGGLVGSGKTALIEAIASASFNRGMRSMLVSTSQRAVLTPNVLQFL